MSILPVQSSPTSTNPAALSVQRYRLDNGLRVWVQARPDAT